MKAILYGNIGLRTFNVLEVEVLHPYFFTEKILKRTDNQVWITTKKTSTKGFIFPFLVQKGFG